MSRYLPVNPAEFAGKRWLRPTGYGFATGDALCPLVPQEMPAAALALPIAFVQHPGGFTPVAMLGLAPGRSLCVDAAGQWLGGYVPALYRGYPFRIAATTDEQEVLCFDMDSGLLTESGDAGEAFFDAPEQPGKVLLELVNFFKQLTLNQRVGERACAALAEHGLFVPWSITLQTPAGEKAVQGLWRVDEERLNALEAPVLKAVQQAGGLVLAYTHMLSIPHLQALGQRATPAAGQPVPAAPAPLRTTGAGDLDLEFLNQGGTIRLGGL
jgi:hypothetical protein